MNACYGEVDGAMWPQTPDSIKRPLKTKSQTGCEIQNSCQGLSLVDGCSETQSGVVRVTPEGG